MGTLVSGSGPHSGDSADVPRMQLSWTGAAWVHGILGAAVLVLAAVLLAATRDATPRSRLVRRRVIAVLAVTGAQGLIGLVQAWTGLPEVLVALHLLGSALVWVGVLRVLLDANPELFSRVGSRQPSSRGDSLPIPGSAL